MFQTEVADTVKQAIQKIFFAKKEFFNEVSNMKNLLSDSNFN